MEKKNSLWGSKHIDNNGQQQLTGVRLGCNNNNNKNRNGPRIYI